MKLQKSNPPSNVFLIVFIIRYFSHLPVLAAAPDKLQVYLHMPSILAPLFFFRRLLILFTIPLYNNNMIAIGWIQSGAMKRDWLFKTIFAETACTKTPGVLGLYGVGTKSASAPVAVQPRKTCLFCFKVLFIYVFRFNFHADCDHRHLLEHEYFRSC